MKKASLNIKTLDPERFIVITIVTVSIFLAILWAYDSYRYDKMMEADFNREVAESRARGL